MAAGSDTAIVCADVLKVVAGADPALTQRVAKARGALQALAAAVEAGGDACVPARDAVAAINRWARAAVAASGARCAHCSRSANRGAGERVRVCVGCNKARFCSAECQRHAWTVHKVACRALAATSAANEGA